MVVKDAVIDPVVKDPAKNKTGQAGLGETRIHQRQPAPCQDRQDRRPRREQEPVVGASGIGGGPGLEL